MASFELKQIKMTVYSNDYVFFYIEYLVDSIDCITFVANEKDYDVFVGAAGNSRLW